MANQLELELTGARAPLSSRARGFLASSRRALLSVAPIAVPLLFLAQLVALGLWRANEERLRLDRAEAEMRARVDALRAEELEQDARARMLSDEVYEERVRRSLVDPKSPTLTVERARDD